MDERSVGTGCGAFTASIESVGPPLSGNRNYSVRVMNAAPNEAVALLISRRTRSTPLDFFGFPGCTLEVDIMVPAFLTSIPGFTDGAGDRTVPFAVPPSLVNTLFFQFLYLNPTDPVLPIGATPGLGVRFTR